MKVYITIAALILAGVIIAFAILNSQPRPEIKHQQNHIYATWETMEFDKCVSAWLITRYVDKEAVFKFYPQGTEITAGTVFDVPGAAWSRKHRQCTSQCILESMQLKNPIIERIVEIAGQVELNFWQLDNMPQARTCFDEVMDIISKNPDTLKCFEESGKYFDQLYKRLETDLNCKERIP